MKKKLPLSIVIPTKDREQLLLKSLNFLNKNIFFFNEVIIVDSSVKKFKIQNFKKLNIRYYKSKPSTSIQRNIGLQKAKKTNKYIMFLDDDIKFKNDAFEQMYSFIKKTNNSTVGIGFNLITKINYEKNLLEKIKKNFLFSKLGIYDSKPGVISSSGWQTKAINLKKDTLVEWLPTAACIYKIDKIKFHRFSTQLGKYAYLEDVLFSHEISKKGDLIIHSKSKYKDTNTIERNSFLFGVKEIKNRIIFVQKNKLPIKNFILGYFFFIIKNFFNSFSDVKKIMRFAGNIVGAYYLVRLK